MSENSIKFQVIKEIVYDLIHLNPGDEVWQMDPWRKMPEGHELATFKTNTGDWLPLLRDEVEEVI